MTGAILYLEASKQRNTFGSAMILIGLTVILANVEGLLLQRDLLEVTSAVAQILLVCAVPMLAMLLGASAGVSLRTSLNRNAEEPLPFPPVRKLLGAYIVSLAYLLEATTVLAILNYFTGTFSSFWLSNWKTEFHIALVALPKLHLLCFLLSYWLRQPALGAGLALAMITVELYGLWLLSGVFQFPYYGFWYYSSSEVSFFIRVGVCALIGWCGATGSMFFLARNLETQERNSYVKSFFYFAGLAAGAIAVFCTLHAAVRSLNCELFPIFYRFYRLSLDPNLVPFEGSLFGTAAGHILRIDERGERRILYRPENYGLFDASSRIGNARTFDLFQDSQGTIWTLGPPDHMRTPDVFEIHKASFGSSLEHHSTFVSKDITPSFFAMRGMEVCLYGHSNNRLAYAPVPNARTAPRWVISGSIQKSLWLDSIDDRFRPEVMSGQAAELILEGKALSQRLQDGTTRFWKLPGKGVSPLASASSVVPAAFGSGMDMGFLLVIEIEAGASHLIMCLPDGDVRTLWDAPAGAVIRRRIIPGGGTAWLVDAKNDNNGSEAIIVIDLKGNIFTSKDLHRIREEAGVRVTNGGDYVGWDRPVRLHGKLFSMVTKGILMEINLITGHVVYSTDLRVKRGKESILFMSPVPAREGIYYIQDERIKLATWDHHTHDLGSASLQQ